MTNIKNKTILVTGGNGFLGKHIVKILRKKDPKEIIIPRSKILDLRIWENCQKAVNNVDLVIHAAGNIGGIGYNKSYPGTLFEDNVLMGVQLLKAAKDSGVKKFVNIGTICEYPKYTPVPFKEEDLWNGFPEETNAPYGIAKKIQLVQGVAYKQQYNFNSIHLLPVNLYGPGDNFIKGKSHVIPDLIMRIHEAKKSRSKNITAWGTGNATREFIYVEDAAEGIVMALEKYDEPDPINIGAGSEIRIKDLVNNISDIIGFKGKIIWDETKPDGQPRRCLDTSKAFEKFGFKAKTKFEEGLKKEIEWYLKFVAK